MIRYTLTCADGHSFESWFASADAYEALRGKHMVECAACGSTRVDKSLMAPSVSTSDQRQSGLPAPAAQLEALRKEVESKADYVGRNFASEARSMHDGHSPERSIYGEATAQDAKALVDDGVPVLPLPFTPRRRQN